MAAANRIPVSGRYSTCLARQFLTSEAGASAIEAAILAGIIGFAIVGGLTMTRMSLRTQYDCIGAQMASQSSFCEAEPTSLPFLGDAAIAQAKLSPGSQITLSGQFFDRAGANPYSVAVVIEIGPRSSLITLTNRDTGLSTTTEQPLSPAGVYTLDPALLAAIGPGAANVDVADGLALVMFAVLMPDGGYKLFYGTHPAR